MKKEIRLKKEFDIPFSGLKLGFHDFEFDLKPTFFQVFEMPDVSNGEVKMLVQLEKKSHMLVFSFSHKGFVTTICDRCGDELQIEIQSDEPNMLYVKFGESFFDDQDESITISNAEHTINIADYVYEFVYLSLPQSRRHQNEKDCNQEAIEFLNNQNIETEEKPEVDPRWEALFKLNNN